MSYTYTLRPITDADREPLATHLFASWGALAMVTRGSRPEFTVHWPGQQAGFIAVAGDALLGVVTYYVWPESWELVLLESFQPGQGVGSALMNAVEQQAREQQAPRLWLVTTNDNLHALRFYQRRGWHMVAVHTGAVNEARERFKPQIPRTGDHDIPIRDEIELVFPKLSASWR